MDYTTFLLYAIGIGAFAVTLAFRLVTKHPLLQSIATALEMGVVVPVGLFILVAVLGWLSVAIDAVRNRLTNNK